MTSSPEPRRLPPSRCPAAPRPDHGLTCFGLAALLLTAAVSAATALACAGDRPGWPRAVAFAAAVCLPGSLAAWVVARLPTEVPARAVAASLAAIVLRIIPPLAGLAWLSRLPRDSSTAERGGILVVFYLALLATDILLHMMGNRGSRRSEPPPD